jgi:UDP-N-acetylglucosamine--N-acetylmuramyl-(pentapeptide) pyrophosphoryl-undecaprenol N-acetylglucosamine transferase
VCGFAATGLPAVFVPYPVGNGEQRLNATDAVSAGGAILIDDANFTPAWIAAELVPLLADAERLEQLAAGIASVGSRDGADRMVALVQDAAK